MEKITDLHVHTRFSCDSSESFENHCRRAIGRGVSAVCFTDHADFNKADDGYGFCDPDAYFAEFARAGQTYGGQVELLAGVEFDEPHIFRSEFDALKKYPYDFILGSVHLWHGDLFPSQMIQQGISAEDCFETYWDELEKAAEAGGFDCLGHFDFPKRFYKKLVYKAEKIEKICRALIKNGVAVELNTSSLRRGMDVALPDKEILSIYKQCGGRCVTIGSDAHSASDLAAGNAYAKKLIEYFGFAEVIFRHRKIFEK